MHVRLSIVMLHVKWACVGFFFSSFYKLSIHCIKGLSHEKSLYFMTWPRVAWLKWCRVSFNRVLWVAALTIDCKSKSLFCLCRVKQWVHFNAPCSETYSLFLCAPNNQCCHMQAGKSPWPYVSSTCSDLKLKLGCVYLLPAAAWSVGRQRKGKVCMYVVKGGKLKNSNIFEFLIDYDHMLVPFR